MDQGHVEKPATDALPGWNAISVKRAQEASTILLVEEDDLVRLMAIEMLADAGYAVFQRAMPTRPGLRPI